ncbi:MAG TPA: hypothetical protein VLA74_10445 [Nitrososphaeraceae archaeon]|nr:hypothetical protein [Nitrososphaeraceae archaeon]
MFNLLSIFGEFGEVWELLKKKDFPSQIKFSDPQTNNTIEILIFAHTNNEINFNIKVYANNKQINTVNLNQSSLIFFQKQYSQYIKQVSTLKIMLPDNLKNKVNFFSEISSFFKLSWKFINQFEIQPILFYPFTLLDVYSIDDYNKNIVSRTIMRSFDKINVINNSYIDKKKILLEIHNLNVALVDIIVQNRIKLILKMFTLGTRFFIRFVRIYLFIFGALFNIIFFLNENPQISDINLSTKIFEFIRSNESIVLPIIVNAIISIIWFLLPRIIRKIITMRLQKRNNIIQLNKFFSKFK